MITRCKKSHLLPVQVTVTRRLSKSFTVIEYIMMMLLIVFQVVPYLGWPDQAGDVLDHGH